MTRVPGGQPEGNDGPENIRAGSIDWGHLLLVGAGPGLGLAIAHRFAAGGYRVTLVARSTDRLGELARSLDDTGAEINTVQADASSPEDLRARMTALYNDEGAPGVVIYNAVVGAPDQLLSSTVTRLQEGLRSREAKSWSHRCRRRSPTWKACRLPSSSWMRMTCFETKARPTPTSCVTQGFRQRPCVSTARSTTSCASMPCVTPNRLAPRLVSPSRHYGELSAPTKDKKGAPKRAKVLCVLCPDPRAASRPSTHEKASPHWITIRTAQPACWRGRRSLRRRRNSLPGKQRTGHSTCGRARPAETWPRESREKQ